MPTAAKLQWPQGQPLFEVQWRAVAESLAGNGVAAASDLEVTATATDLEIEVASGTAYYLASESTLGAAETHTLSAGDGTYDRWDTVYIDTSTDSSGVREGTPAADPEPPDVQGDELLLAVVYVPQNATDVPDADVLNWRAQFSNEAEEVHYDDSTGTYGVSSVDGALDELQEAAQIGAYPLAAGDLASPFGLPVITDMDAAGTDLTDSSGPGVLYESANGWFRNEVVQALANLTGDEQFTQHPLALADLASPYPPADIASVNGYPFQNADLANSAVTVAGNQVALGGTTGVDLADLGLKPHSALDDAPTDAHHIGHEHPGDRAATADITDDQGNTIYDYTNQVVAQALLGGPASSLSAYPLVHNTDTDAPVDAHHTPPAADTDTQSGDGSAVTFTIPHSLGSTPSVVSVQPASADAAGDFYVSAKTSADVEVTYLSAPASGTDNLSWEVLTAP